MSLIKLPGLIDCHVHLRDPGATHKEDFRTGSQAAIAGGFTTIIDMPNNPIPTTTLERVKQKIRLSQKKAFCNISFYLGADQNNFSEFKRSFPLVKGLKVYLDSTTGPLLITELKILKEIFEKWPKGKPILVHAEDAKVATVLGLVSIFQKPTHFCHVSQESEILLIKKAKQMGLPITCEVTPHHLFLNDKDAKRLGNFGLVKPPLRPQIDVDSLWKNLKYIDCFTTDHAPHTRKEKQAGSFGLPGLETALPLLLNAVNQKRLGLDDIILRLYTNPAKIFKINQSKNTYIEVNLKKSWKIQRENLFTNCGWTPFDGLHVQGKVGRVVINNKRVFPISQKLAYARICDK